MNSVDSYKVKRDGKKQTGQRGNSILDYNIYASRKNHEFP